MANFIPVTVHDFINVSTELLSKNNIDEARLNVELLLCEVLKYDRMKLYLNFDKPLSAEEIKVFKEYLNRRVKNEPVQYILGKTFFYGLELRINDKVLIPRPETELLVERMLTDIKESGRNKVSIFEIGAGSGCIAIALAKNLEKENILYEIFSIDSSKEAIEASRRNSELNNINNKMLRFYVKDVFEINKLNKGFNYIVSNPPYISKEEFNGLQPEVKDHEPSGALTDFGDGLKFFERIFMIASDEHFKGSVFCEIGFGQKERIEALMKQYNFSDYAFFKDYNNIYRIFKLVTGR